MSLVYSEHKRRYGAYYDRYRWEVPSLFYFGGDSNYLYNINSFGTIDPKNFTTIPKFTTKNLTEIPYTVVLCNEENVENDFDYRRLAFFPLIVCFLSSKLDNKFYVTSVATNLTNLLIKSLDVNTFTLSPMIPLQNFPEIFDFQTTFFEDQFFIFGGVDKFNITTINEQLIAVDINSFTFSYFTNENTPPPSRSGGCLVKFSYSYNYELNLILFFGKSLKSQNSSTIFYNDMWKAQINLKSQSVYWTEIQVSRDPEFGLPPKSVYGSCAAFNEPQKSKSFYFGGTLESGILSNDLWELNCYFNECSWKLLSFNNYVNTTNHNETSELIPSPNNNSVIQFYDDIFFIFNGIYSDSKELDIMFFNNCSSKFIRNPNSTFKCAEIQGTASSPDYNYDSSIYTILSVLGAIIILSLILGVGYRIVSKTFSLRITFTRKNKKQNSIYSENVFETQIQQQQQSGAEIEMDVIQVTNSTDLTSSSDLSQPNISMPLQESPSYDEVGFNLENQTENIQDMAAQQTSVNEKNNPIFNIIAPKIAVPQINENYTEPHRPVYQEQQEELIEDAEIFLEELTGNNLSTSSNPPTEEFITLVIPRDYEFQNFDENGAVLGPEAS
ncbi:hypothetical protein HDU92_004427 [Lobulomyces angularis]|nr:hypothetical protein HDU92_004427 [Lobulomyces angularis]